MATPQDLTTTVSGRRCTRSRARTAASSTLTSIEAAAPTELTSTTTTQDAAQTQTTAAEAPPPPPPSSTSTTDAAQQAPPPETTSSTTGTTLSQSSILANIAPSAPVAAAPDLASEVDTSQAAVSAAAGVTTAPSSTSSAASSDAIPAAVTSNTAPSSTLASVTSVQSSTSVLSDQPVSSEPPQESSPADQPQSQPDDPQNLPDQLQPSETGVPSGGEAGVTAPDQGPGGDDGGLTLPSDGQTNVAGIAGGVVGGFVALAVVSALLFLCLRRRKTGTFEKWQRKMSEKSSEDSGIQAKFKAATEKLRAIPASLSIMFAKLKGNKSGPNSNPYRRHTVRSSVSSVYSTTSNGRSPSISEPSGGLRQQLRGFGGRMPSLKRSRTLLQKKNDSFVTGSKSPFPGIVDDPVLRNSKGPEDPFKDPEPPKKFLLMNPDPPTPRTNGLADQQRGPLTPKPAAVTERSKDPFASIMDEIDKRNGSGTPEWLKEAAQAHKRTTSSTTALRSHPPSNYTASVYTTAENPFFDPSDAPPVPTQPLPPNPPVRPSNAYGPLPAFNATSSTISRDSDASFYFGEPGPTRPGTTVFGNKVRQSDPFDLDRPEVLSFGAVNGRGVRASVTRQNSRARKSNVPNWVNVNDGPYKQNNAGLSRFPSVKK